MLIPVCAGLLAAGVSFAAEPQGQVVDRVVAVVRLRSGGAGRLAAEPSPPPLPADVITLSGLEFEARVALIQRGALRAATEPLDDEALRGALEFSISERLLAGEADALGAWPAEQGEVDAAVRAFRERFPSDAEFRAFLGRHEADVQVLSRVLERGLRAGKVLDSKVRLRAQVQETDVRRYFEANKARLGDASYEDVRSALREKLVRERYQKLAEDELDQLRRTHDVRRIGPFAREKVGQGG